MMAYPDNQAAWTRIVDLVLAANIQGDKTT
jgi:hypothetical protein